MRTKYCPACGITKTIRHFKPACNRYCVVCVAGFKAKLRQMKPKDKGYRWGNSKYSKEPTDSEIGTQEF